MFLAWHIDPNGIENKSTTKYLYHIGTKEHAILVKDTQVVCVCVNVCVCVCMYINHTNTSLYKKNKGIVYTMDHEVVPRPCKIYDWLLNSTWGHFNLHWGKIVRVTMESEVPKRHIWRHALSTDMCPTNLRWERQKRCSSKKKTGAHGKEILV